MPKYSSPTKPQPPETGVPPALAVFARAAVPGKSKTRLIPALGPKGAAEFHAALLADTLHKAAKLRGKVVRYLFITGGDVPASALPPYFGCLKQRGRGLGERLERGFETLLRKHPRALVIGTDSPALAPLSLRLAFEELRVVDAVLGPCPDGGYYLIGLRRTVRGLFRNIRLGSEFAFQDTLDRLIASGFSCSILDPLPDIDRPEDLAALKRSLIKKPALRRRMPATWKFMSRAPDKKLPAVRANKK